MSHRVIILELYYIIEVEVESEEQIDERTRLIPSPGAVGVSGGDKPAARRVLTRP